MNTPSCLVSPTTLISSEMHSIEIAFLINFGRGQRAGPNSSAFTSPRGVTYGRAISPSSPRFLTLRAYGRVQDAKFLASSIRQVSQMHRRGSGTLRKRIGPAKYGLLML